MNKQTIERLRKNPHYKMSGVEQAAIIAEERPPIMVMGSFERHSAALPLHSFGETPSKIERKKGKKRKQ